MRFEQPHLLWLLLVLPPALMLFFWWASRKRRQLLTQFIQTRLLPALTVGISPFRQKIRLGCLILAVTLLVVALARPQYGFDLQKIKQRGLDIVVAVDTSKSMLAGDIAPNRLERAKLAVLDLMQQAKPDRLGLVAFAGDAFLECPLTFDSTVFQQCVQTLNANTLPQGGTAIAAAIKTAQTAFKESDHYKVLVLFTDGEDNDGGAVAAAQEAAKVGLKIFTIGIGTPQGDLLRVTDASGNSDYIRDANGNVVKSHLNEMLLQQIAAAAGGFYLPLRGANTMETLYEKGLAPLPKSEGEERLVRRYHEQYHWPLAAAALLLLAEMFLPERKKSAVQSPQSKVKLPVAVALVGILLLPIDVKASASSALREYDRGQYDSALKQYQQLLRKNTDDPRLNFNAGAAAYRSRKFNDAATNFNAVISAPDLKLQERGYYNLGNTLYRLGGQSQDLDKQKESWENALKNYSNSLKLNPQDADAKFNYEFVKKKLEELKKQQQQQQQKQNQQQQKNNQQQAKNNQSSQENQQQQNQQQNQSQQAQGNEQQKQQQQNEQQKPQQNQQAQNQSEQQKKQQQAQSSTGQSNEKQGGQNEQAQAMSSNEMTPEEARRLLDAQKGNEQFLQPKPQGKPRNDQQPIKDW